MIYLILDGNEINSRDELFDAFEKHLSLPSYTGRNLDAIHEVLLEDILPKGELKISVINYNEMKEKIGRTAIGLYRMLTDVTEEDSRLTIEFDE